MDLSNLPIEEVFSQDLENIAIDIEIVLGDYLLPSPNGIYICTKLEPVMVDGNDYFVKKNNDFIPLKDINQTELSIYDANGKCVIPSSFMKNKGKYISNKPHLPYRGIKIIDIMIKDFFNSVSEIPYLRSNPSIDDKLLKQIYIPDDYTTCEYDDDIDTIEEIFINETIVKIHNTIAPLLTDVRKFIGNDYWHMYTIRLKDKLLRIEKNVDYRIYDWYRIKEGRDEL